MASEWLLLCAACSPGFFSGTQSPGEGLAVGLFLLLPPAKKERGPSPVRPFLVLIGMAALLECAHLCALCLPLPHARALGLFASLLLMGAVCRKGFAFLPLLLLPGMAAFLCLALQGHPFSPEKSLCLPDTLATLLLIHSIKRTPPGANGPRAAWLYFLCLFLREMALPQPLLLLLRNRGKTGYFISLLLLYCASFLRSCVAWHGQTALKSPAAPSARPAAGRHPPKDTGASGKDAAPANPAPPDRCRPAR